MIKFSIFTLNLRFGLAKDGDNDWSYRKTVFPDLLNAYPSDFYCFQEANDFQINFLQDILVHYKVVGKRHPAPKFWQNNVIFFHSSWQCVYFDHFFLSLTPEIPSRYPKSKWPRQCTMGVFHKADYQLVCVNTHFDFNPEVQDRSAELILAKLSEVGPDLPTILVGDFNAAPSSSCYAILTSTSTASGISAAGFKNSFAQPFPGTHHGFTGSVQGDYIDWILYRGDMTKTESAVITDSFDGRFPSDHFPLTASFSWVNP